MPSMASMLCSYSMPAAARAPLLRANANAAASLGFATSQLAGLSLGLTGTAVVSIPTKNTIVARTSLPPTFLLDLSCLGLTGTAVVSIPTKNTTAARRICPFLEKKTNWANKVSLSNHKTKKQQFVNLQYKKLWWEAGRRYVKLRMSTKALKTIEKQGIDAVANKAGIDLNKK